MIRMIFGAGLSIVTLMTSAILLIHAAPYDDAPLQAFLRPPESCPAPCFMGIQPGVTTTADALAILEAHPWVGKIDIRFDTAFGEGQLVWGWSGRQPAPIRSDADGALQICGGLVCSLSIPTALKFGAIMLALGEPDSGTLRSFPDGTRTFVLHTAVYDSLQLSTRTVGLCPPAFTAMALQQNMTTIQFGATRNETISTLTARPPRYQIINFNNRSYPWLLRRAFVCAR